MTIFVKWIFLASIVGVLAGSASALFLTSLNFVTNFREAHGLIIALLPLAGLAIGLGYHYWGSEVVRGNNQLIDEYYTPQKTIPFRMAPFIFFSTLVTHLFGGSAGREGTAVQMGGAIADQFSRFSKITQEDRKILLAMGVSAGFASVFGTPWAGAVFSIEVFTFRHALIKAVFPCIVAALVADYICNAWHVMHTHYSIASSPDLSASTILWSMIVGIICGLVAMVFAHSTRFWGALFKSKISYPPLRPLVGGVCIALAVGLMGTTKYIGLGVPVIVDSFNHQMVGYEFLLKIIFTTFTLGAGFKGGEVTPLFFVGATLGSALVWFVPLPLALLAGMGFVAVFAGTTNTPLACIVMGIELFGLTGSIYISIACFVAFLCSGRSGIYTSQLTSKPKEVLYGIFHQLVQREKL